MPLTAPSQRQQLNQNAVCSFSLVGSSRFRLTALQQKLHYMFNRDLYRISKGGTNLCLPVSIHANDDSVSDQSTIRVCYMTTGNLQAAICQHGVHMIMLINNLHWHQQNIITWMQC